MKQHHSMKICEISEVLNGFSFKSSKYINEGIRIIRITNVQKGFIEDNNPVFYPIDTVGIERFMLREDDLLISLTGNVGRVGLLSKEFLPAALNQRVACLRVNNSLISSKYLFHFLNGDKFENDCIRNSNGIAQKNMSTEWLKKYEIVMYNRDVQDYIVKVLDCILSLLNKTKYLISLYDKLIKSQFIEMFENSKNYVYLSDYFSIHARIGWQSLTKKEHMNEGDYYLVTGTDFADNKIKWSTCCFVSKKRYDMDEKLKLKINDILITKDGSIGKVAVVDSLPKPATLNAGVFVVRSKSDKFTKEYISYLFLGSLFTDFIDKQKTGATIKHLNQERLLKFQFPCPSIEEQNIFSNFTNQIDKSKYFDYME